LCEAQAGVTRDAPVGVLRKIMTRSGTAWRKAFTVCRSWGLPGSVPGGASTRCLCMLPLASTHSGPVCQPCRMLAQKTTCFIYYAVLQYRVQFYSSNYHIYW
jgi:hypothetical protein